MWLPKTTSGLAQTPRWAILAGMIDLLKLLGGLLVVKSASAVCTNLDLPGAGRAAELLDVKVQGFRIAVCGPR